MLISRNLSFINSELNSIDIDLIFKFSQDLVTPGRSNRALTTTEKKAQCSQ